LPRSRETSARPQSQRVTSLTNPNSVKPAFARPSLPIQHEDLRQRSSAAPARAGDSMRSTETAVVTRTRNPPTGACLHVLRTCRQVAQMGIPGERHEDVRGDERTEVTIVRIEAMATRRLAALPRPCRSATTSCRSVTRPVSQRDKPVSQRDKPRVAARQARVAARQAPCRGATSPRRSATSPRRGATSLRRSATSPVSRCDKPASRCDKPASQRDKTRVAVRQARVAVRQDL
jgi:hypothetical protein